MSIHWYPGHMHRATKEMFKVLPKVDAVIEILDARIPFSSSNPVISSISINKPVIKLLAKSDLADSKVTAMWRMRFEEDENMKTLAVNLKSEFVCDQVVKLCQKLAPKKEGSNSLIMVAGIPNVGKSTLINNLAGRHVANTGDEPAITKGQQRINLRNGIILLDTPGILWPKVENTASSYRLATIGAIKNTAMSYEEVAFFALDFMMREYPSLLKTRFNQDCLPASEIEFLEIIGLQRGCLRLGRHIDLERAATIFLTELRAGVLGGVSYETPEMIDVELAGEPSAEAT